MIATALIGPDSSFISSFFLAQSLAEVWLLSFAQPPDALSLATRKPANPYPGAVSAATRPCFRLSSYSSQCMYLLLCSTCPCQTFSSSLLGFHCLCSIFYFSSVSIFQTFSRTRRYYTSSGSLFIPEGHAVLYLHTSQDLRNSSISLPLSHSQP